ncbi:hypothetical protein ACFL01_02285 [Planctomycetota bacterium]
MKKTSIFLLILLSAPLLAADFPKPYDTHCTERENVFAFTAKPTVKNVAKDKYEIAFAVKGNCDVTIGLVDAQGTVVRHLASGVLGKNAPPPFTKSSLEQKIIWNGKDDLGAYVKEPEKLRVRVMLGLKPELDKRLGGAGPKNLPGYAWGLVTAEDGVYVFSKGSGAHGNIFLRKFDHDGNYVRSLLPPPAGLPESKLAGMGYVEYEKGTKALHGPNLYETVANDGFIFAGVGGYGISSCQPFIAKNNVYFCNGGPNAYAPDKVPSRLYHVAADGSLEPSGVNGQPLVLKFRKHVNPRLAVSPDGQWMYMSSVGTTVQYTSGHDHVVLRRALAGNEVATVFVGTIGKPGSDNKSLSNPHGIDCDAKGRLYVCDSNNNRLQIFSPEGTHLKTIPVKQPTLVRVHQKTGAIYVKHSTRIRGELKHRLTKFTSFDKPEEAMHKDDIQVALLAVDSWTKKPRLWMAGSSFSSHTSGTFGFGPGVTVWEEDGGSWNKICDFEAEAKKEAGKNYMGRWHASGVGGKLSCDPVRERAYYNNRHIFDLNTGALLGQLRLPHTDDITFDKRGYLHAHLNPGFYGQGVLRLDPSRPEKDQKGQTFYPEVPYDYGIGKKIGVDTWQGLLPVKDQPGAKFFQEGIGANMRGDIAVQSNIYYVPKMEESAWNEFTGGGKRGAYGKFNSVGRGDGHTYAGYLRNIQEQQKRGEAVYSIKRRPGVQLSGGTIWVFDSTGEVRDECAAITGRLINGAGIDEDGNLYFVTNRPRIFGQHHFLEGKGGIIGGGKKQQPFTGTLVKTAGRNVRLITVKSPIPMDSPPTRPAELMNAATPGLFGKDYQAWMEGATWFYAGASPITCNTCACPQLRPHTDWYKRTYVPEAYRHSIGIVDTAGNLVMHLGEYGNFDSGGTSMFMVRFVSGTDNHLVFDDYGERLVSLKLNYHTEETTPIRGRP